MQLIVASLNEKSSEESSSDEDSANKSDEEVIEGYLYSFVKDGGQLCNLSKCPRTTRLCAVLWALGLSPDLDLAFAFTNTKVLGLAHAINKVLQG